MSITRRTLRDLCMKIVYQYDFHKPEMEEQIALFLNSQDEAELTEEDKNLVAGRALDIINHIDELDREIESASESWKVARMSKVDLSMIRLALYEIRYDSEVPTGVAINEAVELAKTYGGDTSYQFVNGVLSKLAKEANE